MKILTIIGMIVFVVGCCLVDRHLALKAGGQEEGIFYTPKKKSIKDWNNERVSPSKRLWMERVKNFKNK